MERLEWSDKYLIGQPTIDQQHRGLFQLVNRVIDACEQGGDSELLSDALHAMTSYAQEHFSAEEELMAAHGFPELGLHSEAHLGFVERTATMALKAVGGDPSILVELAVFLRIWLDQHVLRMDMRLKAHLEALASG
jgi:hemerythrin-like metal-binding protein